MNNHISEHRWGEGVEGCCSHCHTLELAHYQYAKNDPDLLRSSQILKQQRNSFPDCRRNHHLTSYFSKVSTPCEGGIPPSHSNPLLGRFAPSPTPSFKLSVLSHSLYFHPCIFWLLRNLFT